MFCLISETLCSADTFVPPRVTLVADIKYGILLIVIRGLECDSVTLH
jgi:hypothetical protein